MNFKLVLVLVSLLFFVVGCTTELHHGLSEGQANEIVVALEEGGIVAQKAPDPATKGMWLVAAPEAVRVEAWKVMQAKGLPRPEAGGFDTYFPREGLVPTSEEERVLVQHATAQELRRTLLVVDGVADAHVNLVLPARSRFRVSRDEKLWPRASVLIKVRTRTDGVEPVTEDRVKRLVAGGVGGLEEDAVAVFITQMDQRAASPEMKVTSVGPVAVVADNKTVLQLTVGALLFLIITLSAALVWAVAIRPRTRKASV